MILHRNATRDFIDFAALAERVREDAGDNGIVKALIPIDRLYPQPNGESALRQLAKQLANPLPHDLGDGDLSQYTIVDSRWSSWSEVASLSMRIAVDIETAHLRGFRFSSTPDDQSP